MPTLKRQRKDGNWEYLQITGEDVIILKNDVAAHLADGTKHVTQAEKDKINGALQRAGGTMTGDLIIESNAPAIKLNEMDTGKRFFLVVDGNDFNIREDSLGSTSHPLVIKNGALSTYGNTILHKGNLGSLGVSKSASGTYIGDQTNNRFINVGFTPKAVFIVNSNMGTLFYTNIKGSIRVHDRLPSFTPGNAVTPDGFYVSYDGNTDGSNVGAHSYEWTALG